MKTLSWSPPVERLLLTLRIHNKKCILSNIEQLQLKRDTHELISLLKNKKKKKLALLYWVCVYLSPIKLGQY